MRPAVISSVPGPATLNELNSTSRPACTSDTSVALLWTNRLPEDPPHRSGDNAVGWPSGVPLLTISRPAFIHTGRAAS